MRRTRLKKTGGLTKKQTRLPVIKREIYFYENEQKSPLAYMGHIKTFPPLWGKETEGYILIDWKKGIVKNLMGKPIGILPKRMKFDRYCPETL